MRREELVKEIGMSYYDLVEYLLEKYGSARYDYYCNDTFRSKNKKVTRTKEGLVCHHIDEDKGGNLSGWSAEHQPFAWQKKDRLVYCNYLEHLLLHIKIAILRQSGRLKNNHDVGYFFTTHGINMICEDINGMYLKNGTTLKWKQICFRQIRDNYEEYIGLIKLLFLYIDSQYIGDRIDESFLLDPQKSETFEGRAVEINYDKLEVKIIGKEEKWYPIYHVESAMNYSEQIDVIKRMLSKPIDGLPIAAIYEDFTDEKPGVFDDCLEDLSIDFHGFGHPQYTDASLDTELYPACNVDEYVSAAYPSVNSPVITSEEIPTFWVGKIPREVLKNDYFYVVRVRVKGLRLKEGCVPFIKCKEHSLPDDDRFVENWHSFLCFRDGRTVVSSNHPAYHDYLVVSLTKDDYPLLKERYDMEEAVVEEGCFFKYSIISNTNREIENGNWGGKHLINLNPSTAVAPSKKRINNAKENVEMPEITVGDIVHHKVFGRGRVQLIEKKGEDRLLEIEFDIAGKKIVMESIAKLTKLEK